MARVNERGRVWKICKCFLSRSFTRRSVSADKLFFRAKSLWHTFPQHFSFFLIFFVFFGGATRRRLQSCVSVCMCEGQTWLSNARSPGQEPRKPPQTHMREKLWTTQAKGSRNCNTYDREGGNMDKSGVTFAHSCWPGITYWLLFYFVKEKPGKWGEWRIFWPSLSHIACPFNIHMFFLFPFFFSSISSRGNVS